MATYIALGSRAAIGKADMTGLNPGNWTIMFDLQQLNINVPYFEIYKMVVQGAQNTTFTLWVDQNMWDAVSYGNQNTNDMNQPLQLIPGQVIYFMYSDSTADGTPPKATLWLRYDQEILANRRTMLQQ